MLLFQQRRAAVILENAQAAVDDELTRITIVEEPAGARSASARTPPEETEEDDGVSTESAPPCTRNAGREKKRLRTSRGSSPSVASAPSDIESGPSGMQVLEGWHEVAVNGAQDVDWTVCEDGDGDWEKEQRLRELRDEMIKEQTGRSACYRSCNAVSAGKRSLWPRVSSNDKRPRDRPGRDRRGRHRALPGCTAWLPLEAIRHRQFPT